MKKMLVLTFILFCISCGSKTNNKAEKESAVNLTPEELLEQHIKKWADSVAKAQDYYRENLGRILPEWEHNIVQNMQTLSTSTSSMDAVRILYSYLEHGTSISDWNKQLIERGYDMPDSIVKKDAIRDKERAKNQLTYFPQMRLLFAQVCKNKYWIDDIDVKVHGNRNQYIHFIGTQFTTNKNIKAFHDDIGLTFDVLRFAQVRYSWYNGGEYTYFNIYDGKDSDPIPTILEGVYWWGKFPNTF